jgi:hypothetical protein
MKGSSFPQSTPSWLLRHPLLLAEWIAAYNFVARARSHAAVIIVSGVAAVGALAVVLLTVRSRLVALFDILLNYRVLTMLAAAIYAVFAVAGRRRQAESRYAQFWLAAAPIRQHSRVFTMLFVTLVPLASQMLAVSALLALVGAVGGVSSTIIVELTVWIAAAASIGAAVGWWSARRARAMQMEGSRYVAAVKHDSRTVPSTAGLAGWPLGQVRAWSRPENLRILLGVALLAVQAGSSAIVGLSVVAIWLLGGYLAGLLTAILHTSRDAALWLRSTPISFAKFAWAVSRRALLHQLLGTVFAAGLMIVLGAPPLMALYLAALWLTIILLACSIGLADSYRVRQPLLRMALSFAALAAVETREHGWSIPIAALIAMWQLRAGVKP